MLKLILLLVLVVGSALHVSPQSGRRGITPIPTAPIQPSSNPEPEPRPAALPDPLLFIPERVRGRPINAMDGTKFRLSDFEGKVIVINIWASWCGPCRREVPEYERVRKDYAAQNVEFIGLTTEDPRRSSAQVKKFLRDVTFGFRLGWADRELALVLMNGRRAIPQTLVIDANGRVVRHWTGYAPGRSGERLRQTIDAAFERANSSAGRPGDKAG